jgi:hypothetical protein
VTASPETNSTSKTDNRHPMGTTTQHPRRLPLLQRNIPYPPNANRPKFRTIVRATLSTMLTTIQNRHPGPIRRKGHRLPLAQCFSYPPV